MVLGAIWCSKSLTSQVALRIREIKAKYHLPVDFEIKWNKVSPARLDFYEELVDFYFDDDDLHFRALVIPDKAKLNHLVYGQTHDDFYYKMYFQLLKVILDPKSGHYIYLDIKDTRSEDKVQDLVKYLRNAHYDYSEQIIRRVQQVRSHEIQQVQLADLLTGAISYLHRDLTTSAAKQHLINRIIDRSGYSLLNTTLYKEDKMNIFVWRPQTNYD